MQQHYETPDSVLEHEWEWDVDKWQRHCITKCNMLAMVRAAAERANVFDARDTALGCAFSETNLRTGWETIVQLVDKAATSAALLQTSAVETALLSLQKGLDALIQPPTNRHGRPRHTTLDEAASLLAILQGSVTCACAYWELCGMAGGALPQTNRPIEVYGALARFKKRAPLAWQYLVDGGHGLCPNLFTAAQSHILELLAHGLNPAGTGPADAEVP